MVLTAPSQPVYLTTDSQHALADGSLTKAFNMMFWLLAAAICGAFPVMFVLCVHGSKRKKDASVPTLTSKV